MRNKISKQKIRDVEIISAMNFKAYGFCNTTIAQRPRSEIYFRDSAPKRNR